MKLQISKTDAARRQLSTAIRLYFSDGDEVSVHTLALAAYDILRSLRKHTDLGRLPLKESLMEPYPKSKKRQEKMNEAQNFFKHAGKDSSEVLEFETEITEWFLLDAVDLYQVVAPARTDEMIIFGMWALSHFAKIAVSESEWEQRYGSLLADPWSSSKSAFFAHWLAAAEEHKKKSNPELLEKENYGPRE